MVNGNGRQSVPASRGGVGSGGEGNRKGSHWMGEGPCFCTVLPDPSLREPGLVGNGWDGRVHQGVGFNERQGFIREIDGGFISFGKSMLCTTARPERKIVCFVPPSQFVSRD